MVSLGASKDLVKMELKSLGIILIFKPFTWQFD